MNFETLRGGILFLIRWVVHYPIVLGMYHLIGWTRAPFLMNRELQDKPGILVSNYGNAFFDELIGLMLAPVWPFSFVKDSLCSFPVLNVFYRFFRCLPIVRKNSRRYSADERVERNERMLEKAAQHLRRGHWMMVFPEEQPSHVSRIRTPLRPGVAHVALRAEDAAGWQLGLHLYVYGTNYENKLVTRSRIYFRWAEPIRVADYKALYERNPQEAENALMQDIEARLHEVVLEAESPETIEWAYQKAFQENANGFVGVQNVLSRVSEAPGQWQQEINESGLQRWKKFESIHHESPFFQAIGLFFMGIGTVLNWPFRMLGRWCAQDPAEDMVYRFFLWLVVLVLGFYAFSWRWVQFQFLCTWLVMMGWLWAWRRGLIKYP